MSEVASVRPHLERRFVDQRVVFWHDPEGQYAVRSRQPRPAGRDDSPRRQRRVRDQEPAAARPARRQVPRLPLRSGARRHRQLAARPGARLRRVHRRPQLARLAGPRPHRRRHRRGRRRRTRSSSTRASACRASRRCSRPRTTLPGSAPRCRLSCSVRRSTASWRSPARCSPRTPRASTPSTTPSSTMASTTSTGAASPPSTATSRPRRASMTSSCGSSARRSSGFASDRPGGLQNIQLDFASLRNDRRSQDALVDAGEARVRRPRLQGEHRGRELPRPRLGRPVRGDRPQDHR